MTSLTKYSFVCDKDAFACVVVLVLRTVLKDLVRETSQDVSLCIVTTKSSNVFFSLFSAHFGL